jgi:hypothetical protein
MILVIAGHVWLLLLVFSDSVLLGLCSLLLPPVILFWVVTNWDSGKVPFLAYLAGVGMLFFSGTMG